MTISRSGVLACLAAFWLLSPAPLRAQASACSGTIEGIVKDINGQPLAGWTVWLIDGQGRPVGLPFITGDDGTYSFSPLPCGNYVVYEVVRTGWTQVFPSEGDGSHLVSISPAAQTHGGLDFQNRLGCLGPGDLLDVFSSGFDEVGNRVLGLNPSQTDVDWALTAQYQQNRCWAAAGPVPANPDRLIVSPPRPAGTYRGSNVWAAAIAGSEWISSWQTQRPTEWSFYRHCFCLAEGFHDPFLDFALLVDDAASVLLNGTEILRTPNPGFRLVTTPNYGGPNGGFLVEPGTLLRPGLNCLTVAVCNGLSVTGFDIAGILTAKDGLCCHRPGRLCGTKWSDLDGDGQRQPGEPGIGGWSIQLRNGFGDVVATRATDADGSYCFDNRDPGRYRLTEVVPSAPRWIVTAPAAPHNVQLAPGGEIIGLDFGNMLCPDPAAPGVVYFGTDPQQRPCTSFFLCEDPDQEPFLNACGCGCVPKSCPPDLQITKRPSHPGAISGFFSIDIFNKGDCPTTGPIVVTDALPPGFAYVGLLPLFTDWSCRQEGGGLDPVTVTCAYSGPPLQPGKGTGVTFEVAPGPPSWVQNCATLMTAGATGEGCTTRCASAGEDGNFCPPGPNPRVRVGTPARPGCTYRWSPAVGLSNPAVARPVVKFPLPAGSATYRLDVTCPGCQGTDWITLNQRAVPGRIPPNADGTNRFCARRRTFTLTGYTGDSLIWECARDPNGPWAACPGSGNAPSYTARARGRRLWVRVRVLCGPSQGRSNVVLLDPSC